MRYFSILPEASGRNRPKRNHPVSLSAVARDLSRLALFFQLFPHRIQHTVDEMH